MNEKDPNGLDAKEPGSKLDAGKAPIARGILQYFPRALKAIAMVSLAGAQKYSWKGWEKVDDGVNRYTDALARHLLAEETEGPYDADTGALHASQVAWNALARLELMLREDGAKSPTQTSPVKPGGWVAYDSRVETAQEAMERHLGMLQRIPGAGLPAKESSKPLDEVVRPTLPTPGLLANYKLD